MNTHSCVLARLLLCALAYHAGPALSTEIEPFGRSSYSVGSTNMEVAAEYADIGDEAMGEYLSGRSKKPSRFVTDILKYPESAWVIDVPVPAEPALYGPVSGETLPVVSFLTYPSSAGTAGEGDRAHR